MSENKDNKLTLINEKTANDYLTHTVNDWYLTHIEILTIIYLTRQPEGDCTSPAPAQLQKL